MNLARIRGTVVATQRSDKVITRGSDCIQDHIGGMQ